MFGASSNVTLLRHLSADRGTVARLPKQLSHMAHEGTATECPAAAISHGSLTAGSMPGRLAVPDPCSLPQEQQGIWRLLRYAPCVTAAAAA